MPSHPLRVVIVGGGVAALEAAVGLRHLAPGAVDVTLVSAADELVYRPLELREPFGLGRPQRFALEPLAADLGMRLRLDRAERVDPARRRLVLATGGELPYDELVLCLGARWRAPYEHGITFDRSRDPLAFDELVADVRDGLARRLDVVVPPSVHWTLPAYELALLCARLLPGTRVALRTHEQAPLEAFGPAAAGPVAGLLAESEVELQLAAEVDVVGDGLLRAGGGWHTPDRIVALPEPVGLPLAGVPHDEGGFLPVDRRGRVRGLAHVHAAGDGTDQPIKQGGLAAQQADAVVAELAWRAGAADCPPQPEPFVLRGLLSTPSGPRYLRCEQGRPETSTIAAGPLWWPPGKIATRWLAPYLARRAMDAAPPRPRALSSGGVAVLR